MKRKMILWLSILIMMIGGCSEYSSISKSPTSSSTSIGTEFLSETNTAAITAPLPEEGYELTPSISPINVVSPNVKTAALINTCKNRHLACDLFDLYLHLSPDEKWYLNRGIYGDHENDKIQFYSMETEGLILESRPGDINGHVAMRHYVWSPDSTGICLFNSDPMEVSYTGTLEIFEIKNNTLEYYNYKTDAADVAWSPDGQYIALINIANPQLVIIDRKGKEIRKIDLKLLNNNFAEDVFWKDGEIFFQIDYRDLNVPDSIYRIDQSLEGSPELIFTYPLMYNQILQLVISPDLNSIVATSINTSSSPVDFQTLWVDLATGSYKEIKELHNILVGDISRDSKYIIYSQDNKFYVFDWKELKVYSGGDYEYSCGWIEREKGFCIGTEDSVNRGYEIFKP